MFAHSAKLNCNVTLIYEYVSCMISSHMHMHHSGGPDSLRAMGLDLCIAER